MPFKRQAVLFRGMSHGEALEAELRRRKIPYVKHGGPKFVEAAHVKDLLALLRWADNPLNSVCAFRVLQLLPGMGAANARKAMEHFEANKHDFRCCRHSSCHRHWVFSGASWSSCW